MSLRMHKGFFNKEVMERDDIDLFVHGCNASGGFGSGVAAMVRAEFPTVAESYFDSYDLGILELGKIDIVPIVGSRYIINAITQQEYGTHKRQVNYEAVYTCLLETRHVAENNGFTRLAAPQIGCGLAGGEWSIIEPMFEHVFGSSDISMTIYY